MATLKTDDILPSVEEARAALTPALSERLGGIRTILARLRDDPPQVIVLEGGSEDERTTIALWYAALLECPDARADGPCLECPTCLQVGARVNADISVLDPRTTSMLGGHPAVNESKTSAVTVENIRELRSIVADAAHGTGRRVTLLLEAQGLNPSCGNALLKVMEEPRKGVHFMMTTPHRARLLPTLVSRGWTLTLPWPEAFAKDAELAEWMDALTEFLASGRRWFGMTGARGAGAVANAMARRLIAATQKELAQAMAGQSVSGTPGDILARLSPAGLAYAADVLNSAQESIGYNVNPSLVLDWMAVKLRASTARALKTR